MRTLVYPAGLALAILLAGCGTKAKDFRLVPLEDQAGSVTLADFKGKTVLLDFWATWCGPCKAAMPEVQELWDKYHSKGLEVVAVSDEDRNVVLAFHKESGFTYPVYLDPGRAANAAYNVEEIPRFILIRDGKVLWEDKGYEKKGDLTRPVEDALR